MASEPILCPHCLRSGSVALLHAIIDEHGPPEPPVVRVSVRGLALHAARMAKVSVEEVLGPARHKHVVRLRHAIVLVAVEYPLSLPQIGRALGGRDHSTIINSRERGRDLLSRDPEFARFVERLWNAGECEPWGPDAQVFAEPEPAPSISAPPSGPVEVRFVEPVLPPPPVKTMPGEYAPRHALPPVLAVVGYDASDLKDADDNHMEASIVWGSATLLAAMRREYPERCAA